MKAFLAPSRRALLFSLVLFLSCLILGWLSLRALRQEKQLHNIQRKEATRLQSRQAAYRLQQAVQQGLQALFAQAPQHANTAKTVQALQRALPAHPAFWHAVALNRQGGLLQPRLPWTDQDDQHAVHHSQTLSCTAFGHRTQRWKVGHAARLASAQRLLKRYPSCNLWPWLRTALLQEQHMRYRKSRSWRFLTWRRQGVWVMRVHHALLLLRAWQGKWLGFALRFRMPLQDTSVRTWLHTMPALQQRASAPAKNTAMTALTGPLSGYALTLQPAPHTPGAAPWLIALVVLCLCLAALAASSIWQSFRVQNTLLQQRQDLFASITHELKTPVAAQRNLLETLLHRDLSTEQQNQYLESLQHESLRLQHLIDNLLALNRAELPLTSRAPCDLTLLCHQLIEAFELRAQQAELDLSCEERTPIWVNVDAVAIELALRNLLDNAIKYTPPQGTIRISLKLQKGHVSLILQDSGPGIPDVQRHHIFEPFTRGNTRSKAGSGLGLYLAQRITAHNKGSLTLLPAQEGFQILLPTIPPPTRKEKA